MSRTSGRRPGAGTMSTTRDFGQTAARRTSSTPRRSGVVAGRCRAYGSPVHASLEHARHCLLVGHFLGSPFSGAGRASTIAWTTACSRAQLSRDYPGQLGESRFFEGFADTPPPAAVIVGLGPWGDLTGHRARRGGDPHAAAPRARRDGARARGPAISRCSRRSRGAAVARARAGAARPVPLGVSSVLMGARAPAGSRSRARSAPSSPGWRPPTSA